MEPCSLGTGHTHQLPLSPLSLPTRPGRSLTLVLRLFMLHSHILPASHLALGVRFDDPSHFSHVANIILRSHGQQNV